MYFKLVNNSLLNINDKYFLLQTQNLLGYCELNNDFINGVYWWYH